ncbi:helix-turn-helix transcriptional regulator [Paracoccus sp. (in: a-proteobacteria)]|uniref:helix-turn-helix domain-containing protein n=1 Tax=Paracoccus sp. TaxID=267 RepID=UPI0026DEC936|nr:helix-turn-helix transcriptional regulator [Paracoccus sp. (in: a-proteobacteria)]MDO5647384.1 helix-turn-helix transcriptional regulator [Paracoccus sp. (in: a-proteobacteria)]
MLSQERRQRNADGLGNELRNKRTAAGFTQKALADAIGLEYYTMVSQMELGYIAIPPSLWVPIANTLCIDRHDWVLRCMREHYPEVKDALFGGKSRAEIKLALIALQKGGFES